MADPLTVLGAVVAASQLAEQSLRITLFLCQLTSQVRGAQKLIAGRAQQIEKLVGLSRQIISSPALQTESISAILNLCLHEAEEVHHVLQGYIISPKDGRAARIKKSLKFAVNEKELTLAFENLGRVQGLLALSIGERTSYMIHEGFKVVQSSLDPLVKDTSYTAHSLHDSLPAIFAQLAAIEQRLDLPATKTESRVGSNLKPSMELCVQHATMNQRAAKLFPKFTSKIMTHFHVPLTRNKNFKPFSNFSDTISTLSSRLTNSTHSQLPNRIVTLAGVACGGKTQVALEFCNHAREEQYFGAIFCVQASSVSMREKGFKNIADMLNVPKTDVLESRVKMVMAILQAWPCPWLLVYDNYRGGSANADVMRDLEGYMPKSEQGSILITRNAEDIKRMGMNFEEEGVVVMPKLRLRDAVEFLLSRSKLEETDGNYEDGVKLALALEKRPRALMQAGTFIGRHEVSIATYHKLFQEGDPRTVAKLFVSERRPA